MSSRCLFTCQDCNQTFNKYSRYQDHLRAHTGERPFVCECGKSYRRRQHLKRHQDSCSKSRENVGIPAVDVVRESEGKRTYPCPQCDAGPFRQKKMVWAHLAMVHRERRHACDQCDSRFPTQSKLLRHSKRHHGFTCAQCATDSQVRFDNHHALRKHVALVHPKPDLKCSTCGLRFTRPSALASHEETHTPSSQRQRFPCTLCYPHLLQQQQPTGDPNPFTEVQVPTFTARRNLYAHIRSVHRGLGFACTRPGCPVLLSTKQKLMQHLARHEQHRPVSDSTRGPRSRRRGSGWLKAGDLRLDRLDAESMSESESLLSQSEHIVDLLMENWEVAPVV